MQTHQSTTTPAAGPPESRSRRRRAMLAWGSLAGIAALITTAAFTDVARLNLGGNGLGTPAEAFNIQVGATDPVGELIPGQWQEADSAFGTPIALPGATSLVPGGPGTSVTVPVRNESSGLAAQLGLAIEQIPDDPDLGRVTDPDYLASLRFSVEMPDTTVDQFAQSYTNLTFAQMEHLDLHRLVPREESSVTLRVTLLSQFESGSTYDDPSLTGKSAFLQFRLTAESTTVTVRAAGELDQIRGLHQDSDGFSISMSEQLFQSQSRLVYVLNGKQVGESHAGETSGGAYVSAGPTPGASTRYVHLPSGTGMVQSGDVVEIWLVKGAPGDPTFDRVTLARMAV